MIRVKYEGKKNLIKSAFKIFLKEEKQMKFYGMHMAVFTCNKVQNW